MRACVRCGTEYLPTSPRQKYCVKCGRIVQKEQTVQWCIDNPDKRKESDKRSYALHREMRLAKRKAYRLANLEKTVVAINKWKVNNPEKMCTTGKKQNARNRTLGFNPLNSLFPGCEAHHINKADVIYIPKELHKSVSHNLWSGKNMEKINLLAGAYLTEDWT